MGQPGLYVIFTNQTYCPIQPPQLTCDRTPIAWPAGAKKFVGLAKTTLRLLDDGKVYDSQGQLYSELAHERVLDFTLTPHFSVFQ